MSRRYRSLFVPFVLASAIVAWASPPVGAQPSTGPSEQGTVQVAVPKLALPADVNARLTPSTPDAAKGMTIVFTITVRNLGKRPVSYTFPTPQMFDASVTPEGSKKAVWHYSHGRKFGQMVTKLRLEPGGVRTISFEWDQRDDSGALVPPGRYDVGAALTPMSRLVISGGILVNPDTDPMNTDMPTKSTAETGAALQTDVTPPIGAQTKVTIEPGN